MTGTVVVVGDALLDVDVDGMSTRVCPDAPAPVVDVTGEVARPGGAALAAALAASDGVPVVLVTPLADDADAARLRSLLVEQRVRVVAIPTDGSTSVKRRVRVRGQTLVRLDTGAPGALPDTLPDEVAEVLCSASVVLVSDYGRGVTAHPGLRDLLTALAAPVVWDPHPRGAAPVRGVRVVTPNLAEATTSARARLGEQGLPAEPVAAAGVAAAALVREWQAASVVVTLGGRGALLSYGDGAPTLVPARSLDHGDTCGAGDRFASRLATLLAGGAVELDAVAGATAAATAFVEAGGAAAFGGSPAPQADPGSVGALIARVRAAGGTVVATGGCFDLLHAGHVASLTAARALGDCLVVCLNSDASVRRLKGDGRPLVPQADRARVLEALSCVDAVVVFDEDSPVQVLDRLRPDLWAKGGDYAGVQLPEQAVLSRWGGQAVVLPYVEGRSTTGLVSAMSSIPSDR